jgi:hypothetical protein
MKTLKILHFFSEEGVTENFSTSAAKDDSEAIPVILPNSRVYVAENFWHKRMSRRIRDLQIKVSQATFHKFHT